MDKIKVKVSVSTWKVGSQTETELEFNRDEWEEMSDEERDDICREQMFELIEWNYEVVSD